MLASSVGSEGKRKSKSKHRVWTGVFTDRVDIYVWHGGRHSRPRASASIASRLPSCETAMWVDSSIHEWVARCCDARARNKVFEADGRSSTHASAGETVGGNHTKGCRRWCQARERDGDKSQALHQPPKSRSVVLPASCLFSSSVLDSPRTICETKAMSRHSSAVWVYHCTGDGNPDNTRKTENDYYRLAFSDGWRIA
jgi:hypothetical protein